MAMFLIATDVFAYQIITEDTQVYEFENGKKSQDGVKYNQVYEVDEKEGTLALKGTDQVYTIMHKGNGNLTATRIRPEGDELVAFKNDGTYSFFMTSYIPKPGETSYIHFDLLAFGTYIIKER